MESELAFFTTEQLIDELIRRKTFLGVVVHSEEELKGDTWKGERIFKVDFNSNLNTGEACRLLDTVAEYMQWNHC
jgi:hypothetical protein